MERKRMRLLIAVCICALLLSGCKGKEETPAVPAPPPAEEVQNPETLPAEEQESAENTARESGETAAAAEENPAPGTLIESGTGLNENYYKDVSYFGMGSNVTENSFEIAKEAMGYGPGAVPLMAPLTIYYNEDTIVRSSVLYNSTDSYEIYAADLEYLALCSGNVEFMFDIIVEDPNAEELLAKEIRVSRMIL